MFPYLVYTQLSISEDASSSCVGCVACGPCNCGTFSALVGSDILNTEVSAETIEAIPLLRLSIELNESSAIPPEPAIPNSPLKALMLVVAPTKLAPPVGALRSIEPAATFTVLFQIGRAHV